MINFNKNINSDQLKEVINYDPETGSFTWKVSLSNRIVIGKDAGTKRNNGYVRIHVYKYSYYAHRLAWLYMTGEWSNKEIDHIDGYPGNNKWSNLREASKGQNQQNRAGYGKTTSEKGIYKIRERFTVKLNLGTYDTIEEAINVRNNFFKQHQKEFTHQSIS